MTKAPDAPQATPAPRAQATPTREAALLAEVEALAASACDVIRSGDVIEREGTIMLLRDLLRRLPWNARPRMPLAVWVDLVDWRLAENLAVRRAPDVDSLLTPDEFAARVKPELGGAGHMFLYEACDREGYAIYGLPPCPEGDD